MDRVLELALKSAGQVWGSIGHNWPYLAVSIVMAAALKLYLNPAKISAFLTRHQKAGVVGATAAAVATPLCSCGTTALALGMIASLMPWAPIIAFLAASPLTSPEELVYSAGLFGWPFAWTFFGASVFVGLSAGAVAGFLDRRGWLANQTRIIWDDREPKKSQVRTTPSRRAERFLPMVTPTPSLGSASAACCAANPASRIDGVRAFASEMITTGRPVVLMFLSFTFVGYFLNGLIPAAWIATLFGRGAVYGVPLAATLGFPIYLNSEASLPLVRTMIDAGMSQGAALAFLTTGAGTSMGAIAGLLTIARWRVVSVVVGTLWVSAVLFGLVYNIV